MKLLEIHVIHTLPPHALNRDDSGRPKSLWYGGVERVRISSQAQKRATRLAFHGLDWLPKEERALRTRRIERALGGKLDHLSAEERRAVVEGALKALGLGSKLQKEEVVSEYLLLLGEAQLEALAEAVARHHQSLLEFHAARAQDGEEEKKKRKAKAGELPEAARSDLREILEGVIPLEVALFGRMLADRKDLDVEGALAVAHAVGTTADPIEEDYFVAVDDLARQEEASAGMLESRGYSAGTVYRYAVLDLDELIRTVGRERALLGARALLERFPLALPDGGQRAFAHHSQPEAILIRTGQGAPRNLAAAFANPVDSRDKDPAEASLERLLRRWEQFDRKFGSLEREWKGGTSLFPLEGYPWQEPYTEAVRQALEHLSGLTETR